MNKAGNIPEKDFRLFLHGAIPAVFRLVKEPALMLWKNWKILHKKLAQKHTK